MSRQLVSTMSHFKRKQVRVELLRSKSQADSWHHAGQGYFAVFSNTVHRRQPEFKLDSFLWGPLVTVSYHQLPNDTNTIFFQWLDSPLGAQAALLSKLRDHTQTHRTRQDSSGRVISSSQRPLPDNTQHSQQTDIHALGGIFLKISLLQYCNAFYKLRFTNLTLSVLTRKYQS